jgi:hypothetical protein
MNPELEECNRQLLEVVNSFHITDNEYQMLSNFLRPPYDGKQWLGLGYNSESIPVSTDQIKVMSLPLEEMPLYINSGESTIRILAMWRLKIGK